MFRKITFMLLILLVLVCGCKQKATPQPTPVPTRAAIPTPTPTTREQAEEFFLSGLDHEDAREWEQAIQSYSQAIAIDPDYAEAYINRGLSHYRNFDRLAAIADFEKALEMDFEPQSPQMFVNRGRAYAILDDIDQALGDYNNAIELDPEFAEAYVRRGNLYAFFLYDLDSAFEDLDYAIELDPEYVLAYLKRGTAYDQQGEYDLAKKDFNLAIELDPTDPWSFHYRAFVYVNLDEYEKALEDYSQVIDLDPNFLDAYNARGHLYAAFLDDFVSAFEDFDRVLKINPTYAPTYRVRGRVYAYQAEFESAIADHDHAIELDPDDAMNYYFRGRTYSDQGETAKAIADFSQAIELDPKFVDSYLFRALSSLDSQDYESGLRDLNATIDLEPEYAYAHFLLGLLYSDTSEPEKAIHHLEMGIELGLDPEDEQYALEILEYLSRPLTAFDPTLTGYADWIAEQQTDKDDFTVYGGTTSQGLVFIFTIDQDSLTSFRVAYDHPGCLSTNYILSYLPGTPLEGDTISMTGDSVIITGTLQGGATASGDVLLDVVCENENGPFQNFGELELTWEATAGYELPSNNLPPGLFPQMAVPQGLFSPDLGDGNASGGGIQSQGDWILYSSSLGTILPVPSGWMFEDWGDETYIGFDPAGIYDEFSVLVYLTYFEDTVNSDEQVAYLVDQISDDETQILGTTIIDDDKGYVVATSSDYLDGDAVVLIFTSRYLFNPDGAYTHVFMVVVKQEEWQDYYPIVQAMLAHWVAFDYASLGYELPDALNEIPMETTGQQRTPPPAGTDYSCGDPLGCVVYAPGDPVRIASALVISGPNIDLGMDSQFGVEIAIDFQEQILGHPIELQAFDDGCSPVGGQEAGREIVSDPTIAAMVGTSCSGAAVPMAEIISEAGYVMVSPSNTAPSLTDPEQAWQPGYLRTSHNDRLQSQVMAKYAIEELGVTSAAAIHDGDPYTEGLARAFADAFEELGGTITVLVSIKKGEIDLKPVLLAIAADSPEFLYYPVFTREGGLITTQARQIPALDNTILAATDGMISGAAAEAVGEAGEGMIFSSPNLDFRGETYDRLLLAYREKYGYAPWSVFHPHAFDAANMIFACIADVGVDDGGTLTIGRQALRDCLYGTENFPGITGELTCNAYGDCGAGEVVIKQLQEGEYITIWP